MLFATGIIILSHEFGHYITAKLFGVRVDRFAFGLPFCGPIIYKKKLFETEFLVHLFFFFGGYLSYPDSNPNCDLPMDSPKRLLNKSNFVKAFITFSGILMNIIFSFLLILLIGIIWKFIPINHYYVTFNSFKDIANESIINSGIQENDRIIAINNKKMNNTIALQEYLRVYDAETKKIRKGQNLKNSTENKLLIYMPDIYIKNTNKPISITVKRDEKYITLENIELNNNNELGLNLSVNEIPYTINNFKQLIMGSVKCLYNQIYIICYYLKELITGQIQITDIRGIFSIVKIGADLSTFDSFYRGLWMISFLSLNMAIINLMPIPVLDGGKLILIYSGKLFQKRVSRQLMNIIMNKIFIYFNIAAYLILINDIISILSGIV